MRKLVLLACAAAALAVPASSASAACIASTPSVGGNYAAVCSRRIWEKQRYSVNYCTDKNLDGQPESCTQKDLVETYG